MPRAALKGTIFNQNQELNSIFIVCSLQNDKKMLKTVFKICMSQYPPCGYHVVKGLSYVFINFFLTFLNLSLLCSLHQIGDQVTEKQLDENSCFSILFDLQGYSMGKVGPEISRVFILFLNHLNIKAITAL